MSITRSTALSLQRLIALSLVFAMIVALLVPGGKHAEAAAFPAVQLADGEYEVPFTILENGKDSTSYAQQYVESPTGKLIASNGSYKLAFTFNNYDWFEYWGSLKPGATTNTQTENFATAQVVDVASGYSIRGPELESKLVAGYYGTVIFTINNLLVDQTVLMHIVVKDLYVDTSSAYPDGQCPTGNRSDCIIEYPAYDHWYNAQVRIDTSDLPLVPVNQSEQPTGPDVDLAALTEQISVATTVYDDSADGYWEGAYIPGARAGLKVAIDQAEELAGDAEATTEQITLEYYSLARALADFEALRVSVDKSSLQEAIAQLQAFQPTIKVYGAASGNVNIYAVGEMPSSYATAITSTLNTSLTVAGNVYATQKQVDAQTTTANTALQNALANIIQGSSTNLIVLDSVASDATISAQASLFSPNATILQVNTKKEYANVTLNAPASNFSSLAYKRPSTDGTNTFIDTNITPLKVAEDTSAPSYTIQLQTQIATGSTAVNSGILSFSYVLASDPGTTKTVYLSLNGYRLAALNDEIADATELYERAKDGDLSGRYGDDALASLKSAIDAAAVVGNRLSATKLNISGASTALGTAVNAFLSAERETVYYSAADATSGEFAKAYSHFESPAYLGTKDGESFAVLVIRDSAHLPSLQWKNESGQYEDADVLYSNTTDNYRIVLLPYSEEKRTIAVRATTLDADTSATQTNDIVLNFNNVDNGALADAYLSASALLGGAAAGISPGQYSTGAISAFAAAVSAAGQPASDADGTQEKSDEALAALAAARTAFVAAVIPSGDPSDLQTLLAEAQAALTAAVAGIDAGQYPADARDSLEAAITATEQLLAREASDIEIGQQFSVLNSALDALENAEIPAGDNTALQAKIAEAQTLHDNAVVGSSYGNYSLSSKTAFAAAIEAARAVADKSSSQAVIDASLAELERAGSTFQASMITSTYTPGPSTTPDPQPDEDTQEEDGTDTSNNGNSGSSGSQPQTTTFTDVASNWAREAIGRAVDLGIAKGFADNSFRPNADVSRAEFAVFLARALKPALSNGGSSSGTLKDLSSIPAWARDSVAAANAAGWILGYEDGSFRADKKITRLELAIIIARAANLPAPTDALSLDFADSDLVADWAKPAVAAAVAAGLIQGKDGNKFDPSAPATRAEALTLILRLLDWQADQAAQSAQTGQADQETN
ncbi:S-layer homology domain-containing protein [Cohnella fermenti]|uniref:SLH domain-containing protein n=1 Tax=Cohnella fermenti TaxID=2565925 RepID=A0A4S4BHG9_9BACL|nr:S-layer homology domain-containing protein [Cohnella fermenti]THF73990.1 hypothetical protein E6C55_26800 [Cohnella fermenti]